MKPAEILKRLIQLSHELGRENRHLAILGEGNVSSDLGDGTFYVKSSGSQLGTIDANEFTRVNMQPIFDALDSPDKTDDEVRKILENCRVDKKNRKPSVEMISIRGRSGHNPIFSRNVSANVVLPAATPPATPITQAPALSPRPTKRSRRRANKSFQ